MDGIPLSAQFAALAVLLVCSAFFLDVRNGDDGLQPPSACAIWRSEGHRGAILAVSTCWGSTDKMLGVILLGNNLVNSPRRPWCPVITIELSVEEKWALSIGTLFVTFCLLVFSEITPKMARCHLPRLAGAADRPTS
jgi:Mg2+/Co2+ transporter CorB